MGIVFDISADPRLKSYLRHPCELVWNIRYYYFVCICYEKLILLFFVVEKCKFLRLEYQKKETGPNPHGKKCEGHFCHKKDAPHGETLDMSVLLGYFFTAFFNFPMVPFPTTMVCPYHVSGRSEKSLKYALEYLHENDLMLRGIIL